MDEPKVKDWKPLTDDGRPCGMCLQQHCIVCGKPLDPGQRKIHAGDCAHRREIQLQTARRRRKRGLPAFGD